MSGEPPSVTGGAHVTVAVAEFADAFVVTVMFVGESGVVDGVAEMTVGTPAPRSFTAETRNW